MSLNGDNDGAEEDEATDDMYNNKREDFAMVSLSICCDNAANMMEAPLPLLVHHPPPHWGLPFQQAVADNGQHSGNSMAMDLRAMDSNGQCNGNSTAIYGLRAMDGNGWELSGDGWHGAAAMEGVKAT